MKKHIPENEYIIIPNPIYDVVFKYLMEDIESAKIVLSTLISEKIIDLKLEPLSHAEKKTLEDSVSTDYSLEKKKNEQTEKDVKLLHLDFTATVELKDGTTELIMIELQNASRPDDIFRFKRYISKNFLKKQEIEIVDTDSKSIKKVKVPIRLIPIFILNFRIENEIDDLLIKTNRIKTGVFTNKEFENHNQFIDHLTYDIWIVQLPNLHKIDKHLYENNENKSKLYALLSLFDQKSRVKDNEHRLRLIRRFFPGFLDRVIKRLRAADIDNPDLEEQMHAEDEIIAFLNEQKNKIIFFQEKLENTTKELKEKGKELKEKGKELKEKGKELKEKGEELKTEKKINLEKGKELEEKNKMIYQYAKMLKENDFSAQIIHEKTNLSKEEIDKL